MTDATTPVPTPVAEPPLAPVPTDAIVLHIGVHKTGTTSLQSRLHAAREDLESHGVTYPGPREAQHRPAMSLVHAVWSWNKRDRKADDEAWTEFADETRAIPGRVLISSEFFCEANDEEARIAVRTLGADRVHVVVGFRHIAELLPSSWQQYLKSGRNVGYEDWLRQALEGPGSPLITPSFWKRNDVPAVIGRWVELVGPERVTVVIADGDRERLRRVITQRLDLPPDLLKERRPTERTRTNRSMTAEEAEFIRRVNAFARDGKGIPSARYTELMRNGALWRMVEERAPREDETKLGIPGWAEARVQEIAATHVAAVKASGATIVGDVESLGKPFTTREIVTPEWVPVAAASDAMIGLLGKSNQYHDTLKGFGTQELIDEVKLRLGKRFRRTFRH